MLATLDYRRPINQSHALARGLVGWWRPRPKIHDGDTVPDLSPYRSHGTIATAGITWSPEAPPGGYGSWYCDGATGRHINIGTPYQLEGLQAPVTISGWFKTTTTSGSQPIYAAYQSINAGQIWSLVRIDTGTLTYYTSNGSGSFQSFSGPTVTANVWHWFMVTVTSNLEIGIALDGNTAGGTLGAIYGSPDTTVPIYLFGDATVSTEVFNGYIGDVLVHNRSFQSQEWYALRRESTRGYPNLLRRNRTIFRGYSTATLVSASLTASASLSATLARTEPLSTAVSGTASLSATLAGVQLVASALSGNASLNASIAGVQLVASAVSASATLTATLARTEPLSSTLSGDATLSATLTVTAPSAVLLASTLSGSTSLSGSIVLGFGCNVAVSGSASLSGSLTLHLAITPIAGSFAIAPRAKVVSVDRSRGFTIWKRSYKYDMAVIQTLELVSGETRTYSFDFSLMPEIATDGDTLSSGASVTASPSGLTLGSASISGNAVTCQISGGTANTVYALSASVTTSGGSTLVGQGILAVL